MDGSQKLKSREIAVTPIPMMPPRTGSPLYQTAPAPPSTVRYLDCGGNGSHAQVFVDTLFQLPGPLARKAFLSREQTEE
jgi:hypothetical protein